jgi:hypothetical protein
MWRIGLAAVVLIGGAFSATGCAATPDNYWVAPALPAPVSTPPGAPAPTASVPSPVARTTAAAASPKPRRPSRSPERTGSAPAGSAPPWCRLADLRFSLSLGSGGGVGIPGSLLMANTSERRCALSGYLTLTWRDANGAALPVAVNRRPDPQTPHTVAIPAGGRGIVGLGWQRYVSDPPPVPCTPVPKTLDIRLPATVQDPHPEDGPAERIPWFTGESAGMCGPKVDMLPVDVMG